MQPTPAQTDAAEQALKNWRISYEKRPDGTLFVPGDMDISRKDLVRLPDLSAVVVKGSFSCVKNRLTSLEGCPQEIGTGFYCYDNELTSLKGAPPAIPGEFKCDDNKLTTLAGGPQTVGHHFFCSNNLLTSLEGGPSSIDGIYRCRRNRLSTLKGAPDVVSVFDCEDNQLTTLEGAPSLVQQNFDCKGNPLESLEGAPTQFGSLNSDLGDYKPWDEIPADIRTSGKIRAQREAERKLRVKESVEKATVLQAPMQASRPFKLRGTQARLVMT